MPRVLIATLCDDVRVELGGKHSLMGIFNQFAIPDFRHPVNSFWIFARVEFEQEGEYPIIFEFRTVEGQKIFAVEGTLNIQPNQAATTRPTGDLKFRVNGLSFPRHGSYELALLSNNTVLQTIPVEVIVPPARFVQ